MTSTKLIGKKNNRNTCTIEAQNFILEIYVIYVPICKLSILLNK